MIGYPAGSPQPTEPWGMLWLGLPHPHIRRRLSVKDILVTAVEGIRPAFDDDEKIFMVKRESKGWYIICQ